MKIHQVEPGSYEWLQLRAGIVTSSMFDKIVTPGGKLSESADKYRNRLIAEKMLSRSMDSLEGIEAIERGKEMEPEARKDYEFQYSVTVEMVGFVTTDDGLIGASPDGLVGSDGLVEIKCPYPPNHIGYMIDGFEKKYKPQVQGQLMVCEREWDDRFSWHPEMASVTDRATRDEPFIALLRSSLKEFNDDMYEAIEKLKATGFWPDPGMVKSAFDIAYGNQVDPETGEVTMYYGEAGKVKVKMPHLDPAKPSPTPVLNNPVPVREARTFSDALKPHIAQLETAHDVSLAGLREAWKALPIETITGPDFDALMEYYGELLKTAGKKKLAAVA